MQVPRRLLSLVNSLLALVPSVAPQMPAPALSGGAGRGHRQADPDTTSTQKAEARRHYLRRHARAGGSSVSSPPGPRAGAPTATTTASAATPARSHRGQTAAPSRSNGGRLVPVGEWTARERASQAQAHSLPQEKTPSLLQQKTPSPPHGQEKSPSLSQEKIPSLPQGKTPSPAADQLQEKTQALSVRSLPAASSAKALHSSRAGKTRTAPATPAKAPSPPSPRAGKSAVDVLVSSSPSSLRPEKTLAARSVTAPLSVWHRPVPTKEPFGDLDPLTRFRVDPGAGVTPGSTVRETAPGGPIRGGRRRG